MTAAKVMFCMKFVISRTTVVKKYILVRQPNHYNVALSNSVEYNRIDSHVLKYIMLSRYRFDVNDFTMSDRKITDLNVSVKRTFMDQNE